MRKTKPAPKPDDRLTALRAHGLRVSAISQRDDVPLIHWQRPPTEAERAQANILLPGALHDA
ncbi:hypothetical protein [Defluviimonas salinarum]|uniref:Uncharacterized protein n=1 Tax=Defluviimonas salinarum TaxID=2992147 RepID=A0ABT3J1I4_9RHOB|nr:hypothetical protein [Defluviimonas salinarum]MCW3781533.1 hypothetical protein [Defluviimonas salinarum]